MAIYTTFFLAKPEELLDGFPAWKPPLPAPVRRQFQHPFTKQLVTIETREPEWPEDAAPLPISQFRVRSIQGGYEEFLEGRLCAFVRKNYHCPAKGLTNIELGPLVNAVGCAGELESPIYAPPSSGAVLREFPADFISKVTQINEGAIAKQWAAQMSGPEHTHSASGRRLNDGWTIERASQALAAIVSLARKATPGQRLFLLIEA